VGGAFRGALDLRARAGESICTSAFEGKLDLMRKKNRVFCEKTNWHDREAYALGNGLLQLVILTGGGHIVELCFAESSGFPTMNPLWIPPWKTIEPYNYRLKIHAARYGGPATGGRLLSGIAGHNVCMDLFGSPSQEEAELGYPDHGEASVSRWRKSSVQLSSYQVSLQLSVSLPIAGLEFDRVIRLRDGESVVYITETVRNLRKADHFCHWVQHVTMGGPFLSSQNSRVFLPGTKGRTYPHGYSGGKPLLESGRDFRWPLAPATAGAPVNLSRPFLQKGYGFVAGVLLNPQREFGYVAALNPDQCLLIGYGFRRSDFPWVAIWEENRSRSYPPWGKRTQARGLEFGTTPYALSRREAFALGDMFGAPTMTCIPARGQKRLEYVAFLAQLPEAFRQLHDVKITEKGIHLVGKAKKDLLRLSATRLDRTSLVRNKVALGIRVSKG
jgi:hypothetical protein